MVDTIDLIEYRKNLNILETDIVIQNNMGTRSNEPLHILFANPDYDGISYKETRYITVNENNIKTDINGNKYIELRFETGPCDMYSNFLVSELENKGIKGEVFLQPKHTESMTLTSDTQIDTLFSGFIIFMLRFTFFDKVESFILNYTGYVLSSEERGKLFHLKSNKKSGKMLYAPGKAGRMINN